MDHLVVGTEVPAGRRLTGVGRPALVALLGIVALVACSGAPDPAPPATQGPTTHGPTAGVGFQDESGMLYPPELWGALEPSTTAGLVRNEIERALGRPAPWSLSIDETYAQMADETNGLQAAHLIRVTSALDGQASPWTADDVDAWWQTAASDADVDAMWMADHLASDEDLALDLSEAHDTVLAAAAAGADAVPHELATEIAGPGAGPTSAASSPPNFRDARDAALYVLLETEQGTPPDDQAQDILAIAESGVGTDDLLDLYLVQAWVASGETERAEEVAAAFDGRRTTADGHILEIPSFAGTPGSTFRMVRYLDSTLDQGPLLAPDVSGSIVTALTAVDTSDVQYELATTAALFMLDPGSVSLAARSDLVERAASTVPRDRPLSLEEALQWTAIAEYAGAMDVQVVFPGVAPEALEAWTAEAPETVAPSIVRLLLALDEMGQVDADPQVGVLAETLRTALLSTPAAELPSGTLFGGALALSAWDASTPVGTETLTTEIDARRGGCLGAMDGFVRDDRQDRSPCNVDSTRYAALLAEDLDLGDLHLTTGQDW